jgi:hypothetical protein
LLILQTTPNAGDIIVKASAPNLSPAWVTIPSR